MYVAQVFVREFLVTEIKLRWKKFSFLLLGRRIWGPLCLVLNIKLHALRIISRYYFLKKILERNIRIQCKRLFRDVCE